jgi:hypothetical protein
MGNGCWLKWVVVWLVAGGFLVFSMNAWAQNQALTDPKPMSILVVGDSLGEGVYAGLYKAAQRERAVVINRIAKVGSGLTSFREGEWEKDFPDIMTRFQPNVAVVMTGGNDPQPLILPDGRRRCAFKSEEWVRTYQERVDLLIRSFAHQHVSTFWLGMPVMREADYDQNMQYISGVIESKVKEQGATFIPLRPFTVDENGQYRPFHKDPDGRLRRFRAEDGKHFTPDGYEVLGRHIMAVIKESLERTGGGS